jgi:thiamine kinase-like enzyme
MAGWDAIDYYHKHQVEIDQEIAQGLERIAQREVAKVAKQAQTKRPEVLTLKKLQAAEAALARWQRKLRIASNKVKKYARAAKRYQKKLQEHAAVIEPLPLAANQPPAVLP